MPTTAANLIERSISHTEIADAEWTPDLAADLAAACDDSTEASDTVVEYWGTDAGAEWRVHLTGPRTVYTISTDSASQTIVAADEDAAAIRFAHGEGLRGVKSATDLRAVVEMLGGYGTMTGPDGEIWTVTR
jgi:hypothetical protein